jgi:hypothetical protein
MSERFKVTKSEDPNAFPNYGSTTGMDADDSHGKMIPETDAKHPPSSMEETIGRGEHKNMYNYAYLLKLAPSYIAFIFMYL